MREREGWKWNEVGSGGYWSKVDEKARHKHKLDFFCPHCARVTGTIDDEHLNEYGFCRSCYVMYVESRKEPAIDLSKYKK